MAKQYALSNPNVRRVVLLNLQGEPDTVFASPDVASYYVPFSKSTICRYCETHMLWNNLTFWWADDWEFLNPNDDKLPGYKITLPL